MLAFASGISTAILLAIHPANGNPHERMASRVSSAWLRHPSRRPTTKITGSAELLGDVGHGRDARDRREPAARSLDEHQVRARRQSPMRREDSFVTDRDAVVARGEMRRGRRRQQPRIHVFVRAR